MKLQVLPLSQEAFYVYDSVIEVQKRDFFHVNNGLVERHHDLVLVKILEQDHTLISINCVQPTNLPLTIHELERRPLGTRAFISVRGEVSVVVVILDDDKPDLSTLRAFIINGEQGVDYHRSAQHHPLFTWQHITDLLIIGRGDNNNCNVESIPEQELCSAWRLQPICIR